MPSYTTPGTYTWTVPTGCTAVDVTVIGAGGGNQTWGSENGGAGGEVTAAIPVTGGQVLTIYVGAQGTSNGSSGTGVSGGSGYHTGGGSLTSSSPTGAGGGGSSAIVTGSTVYVEAGAGGGAAGVGGGSGGAGGDPNGAAGGGVDGGAGATQSADGAGGSQSNGYNGNVAGGVYGGGGGGGGYFGGDGGSKHSSGGCGGGGGSSWAGNGATSITYSIAGSIGDGSVVVTQTFSAPNPPTLSQPSNGEYLDVSSGVVVGGYYNSTDGYSMNAICLRLKTSGGSYNYLTSIGGLQGTPVWISITPVAPGGFWSTTLSSAIVSDTHTYNWSFASQESGANDQGSFATDFTFVAQAPPAVTVTGPAGTITTANPLVTWSDTLPSGASQISYEVVICTAIGAGAPGGTILYDSGVVTGAATSLTVPTAIQPGTFYAYVQISETGGQLSSWSEHAFTVVYDQPNSPTYSVAVGVDGNNVPLVIHTIQGRDNLLGGTDSSFEGSPGNWQCSLSDMFTGFGGPVNGFDSSSNAAHLTTQSGSNVVVTSPVGAGFNQALSLQTNASFLTGAAGSGAAEGAITTSTWTCEFRFTPSAADVASTTVLELVSRRSAAAEWTFQMNTSGLIYFWIYVSGSWVNIATTSTALTAGTTYAIAAVVNSGTATLYINGTSVGSHAVSSLPTPSASNSLIIGSTRTETGGLENSFTGTLDELRISKTARYTTTYTPATTEFSSDSNTNVLYHFDGGILSSTSQFKDGQYSLQVLPGPQGAYAVWKSYASQIVTPTQVYTVQAEAIVASGSESVTVQADWLSNTGTLVSSATHAATATTSWSNNSQNATAPSGAYGAGIGVGAATAFFIDCAGITPTASAPWDIGGFSGQEQIAILRSDGEYVRGAGYSTAFPGNVSWGQNTTPLSAFQTATIYEYEVTPGTAYTYSLELQANSQNCAPVAGGPVTLSVNQWWIVDPTDPSLFMEVVVTEQTTSQYKLTAANYGLSDEPGAVAPNVTALGTFGESGTLTIQTNSPTEYANLIALVSNKDVKWTMNPFSQGQFVSLAIANPVQGMSGQVHQTTFKGGTPITPYRESQVQYQEVGRP